ncbi:MAG: hypothetical protein A3I61_18735 [Acidobacteria bacterium RIFCSPLOWO2_02_FULL_68_18]|nr:MAG: hypothetical protein A3I61_18735 [Acidobacteria bacterium RIFCSPLOWO2_02_FULL_68_18]OFW48081.1 MAG: hypothetical protein A3G77_11345 [Acidobacteria bacterium RIFCSPLOWO2_12_FULL_68_19]
MLSGVTRCAIGVLLLLLTSTGAWAQATAQMSGTIRDESGLVLPGVTVTVLQVDTGFTRSVVTNESGAYALPNLPLGPYRLEMSLAGFQTYAQTGLVLQVGDAPVINAVLRVSQLEEAVTVEAAIPLVDFRSPSIGRVIDSQEVQSLPLEARNPTQLIVLAGAAVDTGTPSSRSMTASRAIVVTGGQPFGVAYTLDGAVHNNAFDGLNLPLPFPDALQEFRVETSSQNAQSGVHAAGTVSAVTKSGTNRFSGNVFEFARHHRFNATAPFAARNPRTGERVSDGLVRNQFGGTLGGPLVRDRLFFFGAYQGTRATQTPADIITFVPTAAMLAGDFTQFASAQCVSRGAVALRPPFVNNRIDPALLSPAAVNIARRLPTTTDPCGRITYSRKTRPREGQSIARMDYQLTRDQSLFGRYMLTTTFWKPPFEETGNMLASTLGGRDSSAHSLALGHTAVLGNTTVNSLRLTVNRTDVHRTHADYLGPQDVGVNTYSYPGRVMLLTVTGGFALGTGTEIDSYYRPNTYAVSDDLTLVRGNHQWGLGASVGVSDWKALSNVRSSGTFSFNGGATGLGLADFLIGDVFEYRQGTPFLMDISQKSFGVYAQDTWKLAPRVTLNYGVRWEPWFPQEHRSGAIYNFDANRFRAGQRSRVYPQAPPGFTYPGDEGFAGKAGMDADWANLQPRVGMAWDARGDGRTSVRAAYAMNGDFISGGFFFDMARVPPFDQEERLTRPAVGRLDDPWGGIGRTNPYPVTLRPDMPFSTGVAYMSVPQDLDTTRVHSWNVGVQQQLGANMAVSASYLGNYLMNAWGDVTGNPATFPGSPTGPCTLNTVTGPRTYANCSQAPINLRREVSQANPAVGEYIGYLDWFTDEGWQRYHGLMLSFQRRAANGLSANANYTVSTCEGLLVNQGAGPTNPGTGYLRPVSILNPPTDREAAFEADKGPCTASPTHIFNLTASVESPQFDNRTIRLLASGWRLSGIFRASSGMALTITTGLDRALNGVLTTVQRVDQVGNDPYGQRTRNNWFNPSAFAQPALGGFGNSTRNGYEGPGRRNLDLSLARAFPVGGTRRVEARVDALNAFNWFRWGDPITNFADANFGRILTAEDPRIMQFALNFYF